MAEITASLVKELREKTGVGMMACKEALTKADGNFAEAERLLREKGLASASKKSDRSANEGRIFIAVSPDQQAAVILELNCETDFVSGNSDFNALGQKIANQLLVTPSVTTLEQLESLSVEGKDFRTLISDHILKLGENLNVKRFQRAQGQQGASSYVHMNGKIGVLATFSASVAEELGRDIAMHIAAASPEFVHEKEVPTEKLDSEKEIIRAQLRNEGKPDAIIDKIVEGKIRKYYEDICLIFQPFVKNPDQKIKDVLGSNSVVSFVRYQLG